MLAGRRFVLRTPTLAIENLGGKQQAVTIPANTTLKVVAESLENQRLVDVVSDRVLTMFAVDLVERGDEIVETAARA